MKSNSAVWRFAAIDLALIVTVVCMSSLKVAPDQLGEIGLSVQQLQSDYPDIDDYRFSVIAQSNGELVQRTTEMFWPGRQSALSKNLIFTEDEPLPTGCALKKSLPRIRYAVCI